jgi:intein/homing endonuclease
MGDKAKYDPRLKIVLKCLSEGLELSKTQIILGSEKDKSIRADWYTVQRILKKNGFTYREVQNLNKRYPNSRKIIGIEEGEVIDVYDMSVNEHENFAANGCIVHNCQKGDNGHTFEIVCKNETVKKELEYMYHKLIKVDRKIWNWAKNLYCMGDWFGEIVIDPENPKLGILKVNPLPADSVYRIETTKGKLLEFQQSKEGPDYQSLASVDVSQATDSELAQATAIRFAPEQMIHMRIGDDRKTFYPYGVSIIEPARGPAHQLRLMEDSMVVYRLCIRSYDKIKTSDGWKYMKDITTKDTIYTYNQVTKKLEYGRVAWHGLIGEKQTYKVKSKHTSVTGTSIHPVIVYDKETNVIDYVKIKNLVPGKHCFVRPMLAEFEPKKIDRYYKNVYVVLTKEQKTRYKNTIYSDKKALIEQSLKEVNYDVTKKNIQKCWGFLVSNDQCSLPRDLGLKICENFDLGEPLYKNKGERKPERINLPDYVTEDFASMFGFLIGDGCINWHKGSAKLLFAAGECPELNDKYANMLAKFFGSCRFQQDKRIDDGLGSYCTNSGTACEILQNMGFNGTAHTKRIPDWVYRERPEIRKAFIKGIADAEGEKRGMAMNAWRTTIRLCNKNLVEDVKEIWESLGFHASEVKKIDEAEKYIKDKLVPASTSWEIYISETEVPFYDEIVSVAKHEVEDVYDLTVAHPTEHNFLCNGVPVSNTRAPERRVFYIDVGSLPPNKAEAFIERLKDQLRKKKMYTNRASQPNGAGSVEERWHAPASDEDFWLPIRPNGNTRIETLPGAQNLGEVDDALYFRNKLLTALHLPKNYLSQDDPNISKTSLSSQDMKFARYIERLQASLADGLLEIAERHLTLRGFPQEMWDDLEIAMTPPSEWREASRMDIMQSRYTNASTVTQGPSPLMSRYDALIDILKYQPNKAREMASRAKMQAIEDMKIQAMGQSPEMMGLGQPGQGEQEMGGEPGGPNPMLGGDDKQQQPPDQEQGNEGQDKEQGGMPPPPEEGKEDQGMEGGPAGKKAKPESKPLPEPEEEDIKKYDLEIRDFSLEKDEEEIDPIELGDM